MRIRVDGGSTYSSKTPFFRKCVTASTTARYQPCYWKKGDFVSCKYQLPAGGFVSSITIGSTET